MNRIFVGVCILLAALLAVFGALELLIKLASYAARAISLLIYWLASIFPAPKNLTIWDRLIGGTIQDDYFIMKTLKLLLQITLAAGFLAALALFRKDGTTIAKYWAWGALSLIALYVLGLFLSAIWLNDFDLVKILAFLFQRLGGLITLVIQFFLIVLAARVLDRQLNSGKV